MRRRTSTGPGSVGARASVGFTLVEMLVVIGIIGLLVAILLPALAAARRASQSAVCLSKIHQILLAAEANRNAHHGYYPLAGYVAGASPGELSDADRAKYVYGDPTFTYTVQGGTTAQSSLEPITNALALVMRARYLIGATNTQYGTYEQNSTLFIRNFLCPSQSDDPLTISVPSPSGPLLPTLFCTDYTKASTIVWYTQGMSYAWNEYVLGWDAGFEPYPAHRLRGQAGRVRHPEQTFLLADGLGAVGRPGNGRVTLAMATFYNTGAPDPTTGQTGGPVTLADALAQNGLAGNAAAFDRARHRGRVNVGFCDGHAAARSITAGDLRTVYLVPAW